MPITKAASLTYLPCLIWSCVPELQYLISEDPVKIAPPKSVKNRTWLYKPLSVRSSVGPSVHLLHCFAISFFITISTQLHATEAVMYMALFSGIRAQAIGVEQWNLYRLKVLRYSIWHYSYKNSLFIIHYSPKNVPKLNVFKWPQKMQSAPLNYYESFLPKAHI